MNVATPSRYQRFRDGFLAGCVGLLLCAVSLLGIWATMVIALILAVISGTIATAGIWAPLCVVLLFARLLGIV